MQTITTHSADETKAFGKTIARTAASGQIFCLHGDLGAGKTTFTKGLAEGLQIAKDITSPTFTLMNVYPVVHPTISKLIHIDTYRLKDEQELEQIGAADYIGEPGTLTLIEWPEKIAALLKNKNVVNISFNHASLDTRIINVR